MGLNAGSSPAYNEFAILKCTIYPDRESSFGTATAVNVVVHFSMVKQIEFNGHTPLLNMKVTI